MRRICVIVVLCVMIQRSNAQLCTGSLGDPVVHISFGNAYTKEAPLKAGVTTLQYFTGCPNDGQYYITNSLGGCFGGTWHGLYSDHTGDLGGRFMVVNASVEPSDFYVDTVRGLCGNTVYEFASWVANVLIPSACNGNGIKPNLTFRIETTAGAVLQTFSSGDIASSSSVTWKQYGTFFTTPAGTDAVVLRIRNNSSGGCGNDLMLDDITFRPCGPNITITADSYAGDYIRYCANEPQAIKFTATYSAGFNNPALQWQQSIDSGKTWQDIPGEEASVFVRKSTAGGYYQYRVAISEKANAGSINCRIASNINTVEVVALDTGPPYRSLTACEQKPFVFPVTANAGFSYEWSGKNGVISHTVPLAFSKTQYTDSGLYVLQTTVFTCSRRDSFYLRVVPPVNIQLNAVAVSICAGQSFSLSASGGISYQWTPAAGLSNSAIADPLASPADTTIYQVIVTNQDGCKDSATVAVNVLKNPVANAGPDKQIFEGGSTQLEGSMSGNTTGFTWAPVTAMLNSNTLTPTVNPTDNTVYFLTVNSATCGTATDAVTVNVFKNIHAPNAFSPNGDGVNDKWMISGIDSYPNAIVNVYNRTGQLVFRGGMLQQWDGTYQNKPVPEATYYYVIEPGKGMQVITGWVLVIR